MKWDAISAMATTTGVIVTATGLFFIWRQITVAHRIATANLAIQLDSEFRDHLYVTYEKFMKDGLWSHNKDGPTTRFAEKIMSDLVRTLSSSAALLLSILGVIVVFLTYLRRGIIKLGQFELEFPKEHISASGDIYINHSVPINDIPQEPAHRQYSLMQQYHTQGLAQAKISFGLVWFLHRWVFW